MRIGLITESKHDYEAVRLIVGNILQDKKLEFEGAFGSGCGDIIPQKKVFSNKLKNQNCNAVIIIRDSDGKDVSVIKEKLVEEYNSTDIKDIFTVSIAVEEIEAWFLGDVECLKNVYEINRGARVPIAGSTDSFQSPKEILKAFINKTSKGVETYMESDSVRIAQYLNVDTACSNSISFSEFRKSVELLAASS